MECLDVVVDEEDEWWSWTSGHEYKVLENIRREHTGLRRRRRPTMTAGLLLDVDLRGLVVARAATEEATKAERAFAGMRRTRAVGCGRARRAGMAVEVDGVGFAVGHVVVECGGEWYRHCAF